VVEVFLEPGDSSFAVQEQWTDGVLTPRLIPAVAIDINRYAAPEPCLNRTLQPRG
jgi:hypothetical protein